MQPTKPPHTIPLSEHQRRRNLLLISLKGAVGLVLAGESAPPLLGKWRPNASFLYLTGLDDEPGAAILFNPKAEDPKRRCVLFLRPLNPELDRWDGYREQISAALKERTGFKTVARSDSLPGALTASARRSRKLACLHPFASYTAAVSPDLALFQKVSERVPGVKIQDRTQLLPELRSIKSPAELGLMRHAISATAAGYAAAISMIRPGVSEGVIARAMEFAYHQHGAHGLAFNTIAGSGLSSTILHYMRNSETLQAGDLIVIDSGAESGGYAADVTRTFPVSGRFTPDQREVYEVVLKAQSAAIRAARVGAKIHELDNAARAVIEKAGHGDAFIHGIGHQLGIEVHDITPDGALKNGMVITVEPGVYLPHRKIGVRIEDDVLITRRGPDVITAAIPKTVSAIESALAANRH